MPGSRILSESEFMPNGGVRRYKTFATGAVVSRLWLFPFVLTVFLARADATPSPVSFRNEVMAVISKAGCNAGMCHGNQNGKAGFKLSLRGEDPEFDYNILTREAFGRRTNPLEPPRSLILLKATAEIAHEGGQRFKSDSAEYELLRRWIAAESRTIWRTRRD